MYICIDLCSWTVLFSVAERQSRQNWILPALANEKSRCVHLLYFHICCSWFICVHHSLSTHLFLWLVAGVVIGIDRVLELETLMIEIAARCSVGLFLSPLQATDYLSTTCFDYESGTRYLATFFLWPFPLFSHLYTFLDSLTLFKVSHSQLRFLFMSLLPV